SGELPFDGESWEEMEHLHTTQPPPRLTRTDRRLGALVQTCLGNNPAGRFASFTEVRDRLGVIYKDITGSPPPNPVQGPSLNAMQWNNKESSLDHLGRRAESIAC